MKDYANELYQNGMFADAMEKYLECLTASNFGAKNPFIGPLGKFPIINITITSCTSTTTIAIIKAVVVKYPTFLNTFHNNTS